MLSPFYLGYREVSDLTLKRRGVSNLIAFVVG
jgi:hypothetical protein